ncbi:helix-turn-helix domain-containing protein [Chryseobacterium nematophagum]|uniref:helix-turn-helix domain-containing protein n=1 Tax=Chryseobacterium nematophagum TaxID=2305228 RepID=UPI001E394FC5|nr:helix-turn-helix domain-containing protein [Chryseobacterium nematophagum]
MKIDNKSLYLEKNTVSTSRRKSKISNLPKINYKRIFSDILDKKYPDKKDKCLGILDKNNLSALDIIELNKRIFGPLDTETDQFNQRHRSYTEFSIFQILDYQKENKLNNSQLARHFKLSRHTVAKWKKKYLV